jgi:capsular polysaccharide biosynthesis protein/MinD-like ATPase involved in chromosome partitioning or flagellar assembly
MDARVPPETPVPRRLRRPGGEDSVEARRYVDALRRRVWLILLLGLAAVVGAVVVSSWMPDRYKATASIVKQVTTGPYESVNVDALTRELSTIEQLLLTSDVLDPAAKRVSGETPGSVQAALEASVDPEANLIFVTATAGDAKRAAQIANAVADTFIERQRDVTRKQYEQARAGLVQELSKVRGQPGASQQEQAIQQRLSELGVSLAGAGMDLAVAQRATPPGTRSSPKPLRNGVIALFLGLFIGVLVALASDQLVPRVTGTRELTRLMDLPLLGTVPYVRRRLSRGRRGITGIEYESYQTLGTSVRFALPAESGPHVMLITSALHAEGKTTVAARLGRTLAQAGHRTLLVSADLRWPTLHELVDTPAEPGLSELLEELDDATTPSPPNGLLRRTRASITPVRSSRRHGRLDVLPSGRKPDDPARLLTGEGLEAVFAAIAALEYTYVIVDAPPLLGIADTPALARCADSLLYVGRLDRITVDNVMDARDVLDRLEVNLIGVLVIGARSDASPYYVGLRAPVLEDA